MNAMMDQPVNTACRAAYWEWRNELGEEGWRAMKDQAFAEARAASDRGELRMKIGL